VNIFNILLAVLLTADAALSLLWCVAATLSVLPGWPGAAVSAALAAAYLSCWLAGRGYAPDPEWPSYFEDTDVEGSGPHIRMQHIFAVPAVSCGAILWGMVAVRVESVPALAALVLLVSLFCLGTCLCTILMLRYKREARNNLEEAQYREEMNSFLSVIRSQRHDYNFHVQTLAEMIRRGDLEECEKYVEELSQDSIKVNSILPIKDAAISAMINSFRILAAQEGITLHLDIQNDMSHVMTNAYETNKVISNLLQNAIDEVKTHPDKSYGIWMQVVKRGEYCVVHVYNELPSTSDAGSYVQDVFRQGYTTKTGHDGVGLSSVKMLLKRYRGVIYSQIEGNIIHFIAKIPLTY